MSDEYKLDVVNVRLVNEPSLYSSTPIQNKEDVVNLVAEELKTYDREVFAIINLKTTGVPINLNICSVGTLDSAMVSPREIFKSTILSNAAAFIAIHNHPSGNPKPSEADKKTMERLANCGALLGIQLVDSIIVGAVNGKIFSMREAGMIPPSFTGIEDLLGEVRESDKNDNEQSRVTAYIPKDVSHSLYISQLGREYQDSIRRAIIEVGVQAGYTGDDLAHMVDHALCGRITDLEDDIHLVERIEGGPAPRNRISNFSSFLHQRQIQDSLSSGKTYPAADSALSNPEPEK